MSAPTTRILSAVDPADKSCTAWFTVNGIETSMHFARNTHALEVNRLIAAAFSAARRCFQRLGRETTPNVAVGALWMQNALALAGEWLPADSPPLRRRAPAHTWGGAWRKLACQ